MTASRTNDVPPPHRTGNVPPQLPAAPVAPAVPDPAAAPRQTARVAADRLQNGSTHAGDPVHNLIHRSSPHAPTHAAGGLGRAVGSHKARHTKGRKGGGRRPRRYGNAGGTKHAAAGRSRRAQSVHASRAARTGTPRGRALDGHDFKGLTSKLQQMGISKAELSAVAKKNHVPEALLLGVIMQESRGNPTDTSGAGAKGLMQLMPETAKAMGVTNRTDPHQSLQGGAKYLGQMLAQFHGNHQLALAAYNAGPGRVHGAVPRIKETQNYVRIISGNQAQAQAAFDAW